MLSLQFIETIPKEHLKAMLINTQSYKTGAQHLFDLIQTSYTEMIKLQDSLLDAIQKRIDAELQQ